MTLVQNMVLCRSQDDLTLRINPGSREIIIRDETLRKSLRKFHQI